MKSFSEMGLPEALTHTLQHMQFTTPTPIQAAAVPVALKGQDILGSAQTGTGKTAAFGIPLVAHLLANPTGGALVMTPTRELAAQVMTQLQSLLGKRSKIKSTLLIGGEPMPKQFKQLKNNPRLIVGTPGRINDHLKRASLQLDGADFLVLDETDRMLDMGFSDQIETVLRYMQAKRQTLLFSATLPKNIERIAGKYLNNPARIAVSATSSPAANIQQDMVKLSEAEKYPFLLSQLDERDGAIVVFVKTKHGADRMAKKLSKEGHTADAIHGDLRQNKRDRVIETFRKKKYRILVATDVAARGLDIPHVKHVINYDIPQCADSYIHRIGRTARAGEKGAALNLITPADKMKWMAIHRLLHPEAANDASEHDAPKKRTQKQPKGAKAPRGKGFKGGFKGEKKFASNRREDGLRSETQRRESDVSPSKRNNGNPRPERRKEGGFMAAKRKAHKPNHPNKPPRKRTRSKRAA